VQGSYVPTPAGRRPARLGTLLRAALVRRGSQRSLNVVVVALVLAGVSIFAYPFGTDLWQSHLQSRLHQSISGKQYADDYAANQIAEGEGLTRLRAPKIALDVVVVQGTGPTALQAGAGHYTETPLPGQVGNVGIAGHRTTYGRPFNRLNELGPGDHVYLDTPFQEFDYVATPTFDGGANPHPVSPQDIGVISQSEAGAGEHLLTLTTCHPKGSDKQRLVLRLALAGSGPLPSK
jgi:sortase A